MQQYRVILAQGMILKLDNLIRKGLYLTFLCLLCYHIGEPISHLLIHCPQCHRILIHSSEGLQNMPWVTPPDLVDYYLRGEQQHLLFYKGRLGTYLQQQCIGHLRWKGTIRVFNDVAEPSFQVYRREKEKVVSWTVHCMGSRNVGRSILVQCTGLG